VKGSPEAYVGNGDCGQTGTGSVGIESWGSEVMEVSVE